MPVHPRILLIGAGGAIERLAAMLREADIEPSLHPHAQSGLQRVRRYPPDGVVLASELQDADSLKILTQLREFFERPVLVLSSRRRLAADLRALELGADDILISPIHPAEAQARLRAALHRHAVRGVAVEAFGNVVFDVERRLVWRGGEIVPLSAREYGLLAELARAKGGVVSHHDLLNAVWGPDDVDHVEYLRVFVQSLRRKLEVDPARPRLIQTRFGVGYRLAL